MADQISITLDRTQWLVLLECAANYDVRVPRSQGDGGDCLRVIAASIDAEVPELRRP